MAQAIRYGQEDSEIRHLLMEFKGRQTQNKSNRFGMSFNEDSSSFERLPNQRHIANAGLRLYNQNVYQKQNLKRNNNGGSISKQREQRQYYKNEMMPNFNESNLLGPLSRTRGEPLKLGVGEQYKLIHNKLGHFHQSNKQQYNCQPYRKYQQAENKETILRDIQSNQYFQRQNRNAQKRHLMGSIKRNKHSEAVSDNKILHEQFFKSDFDIEDLQNIRMSKLQKMNQKLNQALSKDNSRVESNMQSYDCSSVRISPKGNNFGNNQLCAERYNYKDHQNNLLPLTCQKFDNTRRHQQQQQQTDKNSISEYVPYLQVIFDILDEEKGGILSKQNCNVEAISQQFKFIFGFIFTRIYLKNLVCNKRQFIKLCQKVVKQLDSDEVLNILKMFTERHNKTKQIVNHQPQQNSTPRYQRYTSMPKATELVKNTQRIARAQDKNHYVNQSDFQYKLKRQTNQQKQNKSGQNVNLKTRYQSHAKKYEQKSKPLQKTLKKNNIYYESKQSVSSSKNRPKISQSIIREHRKSLLQLSALQKLLQPFVSQPQHPNLPISIDQSLRFDELIKHI